MMQAPRSTDNAYHQRGLGIVEIVVVVAMILFAFTAILQLFRLQISGERAKREQLVAHALLAEAIEATRSVRDDDWANLSSLTLDADYYPEIFGGAWTLSSSDPGPIDGYSRWVVLSSVMRDTNDDIVSSGGVVDPDTLNITAYIEWQGSGSTKTESLTTYLTNWQGKL
jgi:type II secretory pathway pseudopilin PulG